MAKNGALLSQYVFFIKPGVMHECTGSHSQMQGRP